MRNAARRLLALALALCCAVPLARADEVTGTWTGVVDVLGNYYWERSTRVVAPSVALSLESPTGVEVSAGYLVDAITSASQAAGALTDNRFTEVRHDLSAGLGYEWAFGERYLRLGTQVRASREPDYTSASGGVQAALFLNDRATVIRADVGYLHDEVRQNFRGGSGVRPSTDGTTADSFAGQINAGRVALGVEQVISPRAYFSLGYELAFLRGFLANPYRLVSVDNVLRPEEHPDQRIRHTVNGRVAYFIPRSRTALHLLYRAYLDSWRIAALTPEIRVYQHLVPHSILRLRYRHYRQTRAFFYEADPDDYDANDAYVTADPKMSPFHSHLFGAELSLDLGFLEESKLEALSRATLFISFDFIFSTSRYGDGLIGQVGASVPF